MHLRFVLGPAGAGKTHHCLKEIRQALVASPAGPPLVLVAPKHTTYQLERQLLADPEVPGYTRLHILSFERLARFLLERLEQRAPEMLDEEGRLMVLRGLLARKRDDLKLFRASARLTGFAQQLSLTLRELQRNLLEPESLRALAGRLQEAGGLSLKLHDLATLLGEYLDWLRAHDLRDDDGLLAAATEALAAPAGGERLDKLGGESGGSRPGLRIAQLWVDGFAEFTAQELALLAALGPYCEEATVTFCLDRVSAKRGSWLSNWSLVRKTFENCKKRLGALPEAAVSLEVLKRHPRSRFLANPVLGHLERAWAEPEACAESTAAGDLFAPSLAGTLRLAVCADPDAEVTLAAREILRFVRRGGRYREATILVRALEPYYHPLQRVLARYEIPFFLDRRESVSHHPLAELSRSALRTVALGWQHEDWFAALKTGLMPVTDEEIDRLENEALARGWQGATAWNQPLRLREMPRFAADAARLAQLEADLERVRQQIVPPFHKLALALGTAQNKPTGPELAAALRELWSRLGVEARLRGWSEGATPGWASNPSLHQTVWTQMNAWLGNLELAFPVERLPVREWLPILEAGLANLSVGVIPPALDQVVIGALDRSRNPDIKLALVLGLNETVFPALPEPGVLLTETDRAALERQGLELGGTARQQLGRERFLAYIACTRARERLVLTCAERDARGTPLNPSPFLFQIQQLFPSLALETVPREDDWPASEHRVELVGPLLRGWSAARLARNPAAADAAGGAAVPSPLEDLPGVAAILEPIRHFRNPPLEEALATELAAQLYGPVLRSSVSRLEQFAACPFKFFVHSGLRAQERTRFELDLKEQGSFQHDALALFHESLVAEGKRWRDITPAEARERIGRIARGLVASYREGLLEASEETRFMARILTASLQDFVETLVGWMREQYGFDPAAVELPFGEESGAPPWRLPLPGGRGLELYGRIDRVDLCVAAGGTEALCVVIDYKSGHRRLDSVLMAHGLQLQLLAYLNVLRHWPDPPGTFGVSRLVPVGVFYVGLRGKYGSEQNRVDALENPEQARKAAYRHRGRFDQGALRHLDRRANALEGDQFAYRRTSGGKLHRGSHEALSGPELTALLDAVEQTLQRMGGEVYAGVTSVAPYRRGAAKACDQCEYQSICRIDPWKHPFRVLK